MIHLSNSFLEVIEVPADGTRPHRTSWGTTFQPGASHTMGSYFQFIDGSSDWPAGIGDGYGIYLEFNAIGVSGAAHDVLATIGIDLAGGTSYTDLISNLLVTGPAAATLGTVSYFFPLLIPNGASLAIKAQDSNAAPPTACKIQAKIFCKPTHPELIRCGTYVQTFGADTANSRGTAITTGASEGTPVQLGVALDKDIWGWEYGFGNSSAAITGNAWFVDILIGDASNKRRVICNAEVHGSTTETLDKRAAFALAECSVGDLVYGRGQGTSLPGTTSLIAYGIGGQAPGTLASSNSFLLTIEVPPDGSNPSSGTIGVDITPGASNTMSAYVQLLDGSADWPADSGDGFELYIAIYDFGASAAAHNVLCTLGIDLAGGTTYTDWINYLAGSESQGFFGNGFENGQVYTFPIKIPRGSSIAIKAQSSNAAPTTGQVQLRIRCKPTRPELLRVGTFVQTFGEDVANSGGTGITAGTASDGAYVQLGSALDKGIWYWEYGIGSTSTNTGSNLGVTDIAVGDASNKRRVIRNARSVYGTAETITKYPAGEYNEVDIGSLVYGRMQVGDSGALGAGVLQLIAYGVGG